MSYQVLARKWRPKNFQEMVGQTSILRMLGNALTQQRLHHAYLLTGTRGVGKTTLARILAKSLNCESGITATPCGQCATCLAIDEGRFLDLYEIDAASRTKVEDTRELLDNVLYPPNQGRYKVYLIDEVHMLSNHSFNALLKTLEEPPSHVKFLLATTDPKKIPVTILSRCLQFHLKRLSPTEIVTHLQHICDAEKISYESPALEKLAQAADGSMRDALSLLDQAIAYGNGHLTCADVYVMLGSFAQEQVVPLLQALATQDGQTLYQATTTLAQHAPDFQQVLEEVITILHHIALRQTIPDAIVLSPEVEQLATTLSAEDVQLYYQIALLGRRDLAYTPSPQQGFEMTMLRMLAFKPQNAQREAPKKNIVEAMPTATPMPAAQSSVALQQHYNWREILPKLELTGLAHALASNCTLINVAENKVHLALAQAHQPMLNSKLKTRLAEALSRYFEKPIQLDIAISNEELITPVKQHLQEKEQRLAQATETIMSDERVQKLIEIYDATVEVSLIG